MFKAAIIDSIKLNQKQEKYLSKIIKDLGGKRRRETARGGDSAAQNEPTGLLTHFTE